MLITILFINFVDFISIKKNNEKFLALEILQSFLIFYILILGILHIFNYENCYFCRKYKYIKDNYQKKKILHNKNNIYKNLKLKVDDG